MNACSEKCIIVKNLNTQNQVCIKYHILLTSFLTLSPQYCAKEFFKIKEFICIFVERGEGRRKTWRETSMCERYIHQMLLATGGTACNPVSVLTGN